VYGSIKIIIIEMKQRKMPICIKSNIDRDICIIYASQNYIKKIIHFITGPEEDR